MARKLMKPDASSTTSKDDRSSRYQKELLAAAKVWAERMKPYRQQNLTPSQRKELARRLRAFRSPETTWAVSPSTATPGSQRT
jgi:hypothetical protein